MNFVEKFLLDNEIYPTTKGYDYFIEAVQLVKSGETKMMNIYKKIADKHGTNTINVTVAIRRLIMRIDKKISRYVNNSQFIKTIVRYCSDNPDDVRNIFDKIEKVKKGEK